MLSIKCKGLPSAEIRGGKDDKKILSIVDPDKSNLCCGVCSDKCGKVKKEDRCCDKCKNCCKKEKEIVKKDDTNDCFYNYVTDGKIEMLPNIKEWEIAYIAGPSGSGKSTIASKYVEKYKELFPGKDFYLFSRKDKDHVLDRLKPLRIKIDEKLVARPIDIQRELSNGAILVFDDCNTIQHPLLKKVVENLVADIMEVGRSMNIWLVMTNHLVIPNEKKIARTVLNEIHTMTVFPKSGSAQQISYTLKTYFGLGKKQIEKIMSLKSRWVTVSKSYPQYVLYETGAYIL